MVAVALRTPSKDVFRVIFEAKTGVFEVELALYQ
jgi:hypothetical protein